MIVLFFWIFDFLSFGLVFFFFFFGIKCRLFQAPYIIKWIQQKIKWTKEYRAVASSYIFFESSRSYGCSISTLRTSALTFSERGAIVHLNGLGWLRPLAVVYSL